MPNYSDLLNIDDFWEKRENFDLERWDISFYCKDCEEIVKADRLDPKWYLFKCQKCQWSNIAIWTEKWLRENYRIKDLNKK